MFTRQDILNKKPNYKPCDVVKVEYKNNYEYYCIIDWRVMRAYPFNIIYITFPIINNIIEYEEYELIELLIINKTDTYNIDYIINNSPHELAMLNKVKENGEQKWFNRKIDFNTEGLIV